MNHQFYEINERENAVAYLESAAEFLVSSKQHKWKLVIISLHAALYSFDICAVQGTDPEAVKKGNKLSSVWEVLERCKNPTYMRQFCDSKVLTLSSDEEWAIKKLSAEFRNSFEHFSPKLWAIEISGMPQIVRHVARVIEFLALESFNVTVRLTKYQRVRIEQALKTLRG